MRAIYGREADEMVREEAYGEVYEGIDSVREALEELIEDLQKCIDHMDVDNLSDCSDTLERVADDLKANADELVSLDNLSMAIYGEVG